VLAFVGMWSSGAGMGVGVAEIAAVPAAYMPQSQLVQFCILAREAVVFSLVVFGFQYFFRHPQLVHVSPLLAVAVGFSGLPWGIFS